MQDGLEKEVAEHTAYNDACSAFNTWLRATREKLTACSDTHGDEPAIEAKIENAKVCCDPSFTQYKGNVTSA